jgi:hypothetical protein
MFLLIFLFYHKILFKGVDPIMSWNAWAVDWASNAYPRTKGDYPQLMPIIMGLPYIFMGQEVPQIFSVLCLEIFALIGLIAFCTLKDSQFSCGSVVAVVGTTWLFIVTGVGYADVLVGVLALMAWAILHWVGATFSGRDKFFLYVAFCAATAAATIKQSGLFWWPFFILIVFEKYKLNGYNNLIIIKKILFPVLFSLMIIVPWYLYNKYLIYANKIPSMTEFFLNSPDLFRERSLLGRMVHQIFKFFYYTIFAFPAIWGLKRPGYRAISASCLFLMLGWALFFSYGPGNIKFPVMLAFFPLGACLQEVIARKSYMRFWLLLTKAIEHVKTSLLSNPRIYLASFLAILLVVCGLFSSKIDHGLIMIHEKESLKLGKIGLTRRVDYLEKRNPQKIVSNQDQLKQLMSIPKSFYSYGSPPENFVDYGYLVLNNKFLNNLDKQKLYDNFYEDYYEDGFYLFINKKLHIFDF